MTTAPELCPPSPTRRRGRTFAGASLLLALLGVMSLAGSSAADRIPAGTGTLDAGSSAAAGDPALLRSISRLLGLQAAQWFCKGEDGDDTAEQPSVAAAPSVPSGCDIVTAGSYPVSTPRARLRPLQGLPQSPRAPPHLA